MIRDTFGADCAIVCLMSGNYVQRGAPAIFDKSVRAQAAIDCGADLVLELPIVNALSSAEGFAAGGVRILSACCDTLCFGTESLGEAQLLAAADALLSEEFPPLLRDALASGCSFPAARQKALEQMGLLCTLSDPNDILGIEYCKAILQQNSQLNLFPIHREGSYHERMLDSENPSATAVREGILSGQDWLEVVPETVRSLFQNAPVHHLQAAERAILYRLRTMTDAEFEALPYGSEGLWRRLMKACRSGSSLEEIIAATKTKRYTRTRIDRMILCAFLGLTQKDMTTSPPCVRVLAFNSKGRSVLRECRDSLAFRNAGESAEDFWWNIERRCDDLYGLFCMGTAEYPGTEERRRVYYKK